MMLLDF